MGRITARKRVTRITLGQNSAETTVSRREDVLAVEEPLEIRVGGTSLSITMRRGCASGYASKSSRVLGEKR